MKPIPEKALVENYNLCAATRQHTAAHERNRCGEPRYLTATRRSSDHARSAWRQAASALQRFSGHPFVRQSNRARIALGHSADSRAEHAAPTLELNRDCHLVRPIPVARVE